VHHCYDFCFEGLCCLLCPVEQVYEKFPDHCSYQSGTREHLNSGDPISSMNVMSDEFIFEELFLGGTVHRAIE
jgi:hypothetical protein